MEKSYTSHPESGSNLIQNLVKYCAAYEGASSKHAVFQLATTLIPFFALCAVMIACFENVYWLTVLLTLPAAGLLVRLFIIQHDCGHGSFFHTRRANNMTGRLISVLTWTPYDFWRKAHNMHHASSGNLERRGHGGIDTLTVAEYKALSPVKRLTYRLYRNPFVLIILGTPYYTIIAQRFPIAQAMPFAEIYRPIPVSQFWRSAIGLNVALIVFYGLLGLAIGFKTLLIVYIPVVVITAWIGGWLFFIQHQFEDTYWAEGKKWDYHDAAVIGSSYYDLPAILHWFTGNIGLHHIHHLSAKIPNYRLQACLKDNPALQKINRITLLESLKCARLALWDETRMKLISFRDLKTA